jgi:hypothetical protein
VVATYHNKDALGSDDVNELLKAAAWWTAHYPILQASGPFVINLMNEWGSQGITPHDFAAAYNMAITPVRSFYDGPIIVDIPGYGQEAHVAALAITGKNNETIKDRKIVLSVHIYPDAWNLRLQRGMTRGDLDELAATGRAGIVGEFGDNSVKAGKTPWLDLVKYAKSLDWPVLGWAWNGDGGIMNMISPQFQPAISGKQQSYSRTPYFQKIYEML